MYYLTDNPWPAVIVLGGLAICCFVIGHPVMRKVGLICAALAGMVYMLEDRIVSTRENIEVAANQILEGFQNEDLDAIAAHVSQNSPELLMTASDGLELVTIERSFHIRSVDVESEAEEELVVRIRANGTVTRRTNGMSQHVPEYWETTWVREDSDWKLSKATRLDPMTGKPRGTFDRR